MSPKFYENTFKAITDETWKLMMDMEMEKSPRNNLRSLRKKRQYNSASESEEILGSTEFSSKTSQENDYRNGMKKF